MRASLRLCSTVQPRKPSIHFLGKRTPGRSSSLPIRSISNRSQPPPTSHLTPQTDHDAPPTSPTRDSPPRSSPNGPPQRPLNGLNHPSGYDHMSRARRASPPHRPTTLADVLAASLRPPPDPPHAPPKHATRPRARDRVWSGPQWYTPRPPMHPRRRRSRTTSATSSPKSRLPSSDAPDPDPDRARRPVRAELSPPQRRVLALQKEARRRVDRIVNFGRRRHNTGND